MGLRKIVRVSISLELLEIMFTEGYDSVVPIRCTKGLPTGASFVGSSFDPRGMVVNLFYQHESFDPVLEGAEVPQISIEFDEV